MPVETRSLRRLVVQPQRGDRQHRDAVRADQERILVGAVRRAAVLDDAQPPRGDLVVDAVVQQDHAVGHVLLEAVAGQRVLAALAGDDRGHAAILQPAEQAPQLGAQDGVVRQAGEQRLDRVEHDALGADRVDRMAEADEEALEVVLAGLLDLAALDADEVERELLLPLPACRGRSRASARSSASSVGALLERHEDAGLAELRWRRARGTRRRAWSCRSRRRRTPASAGRAAGRRR